MANQLNTAAGLPQEQAMPILTPILRWSWILLVVSAIAFELTPTPPVAPWRVYAMWAVKLVGFGLLGFLLPLAFQRLTTLIRNASIALGTSLLVEILQAVVHHGHGFHWHELIAKALLIIGGFCLALIARYERVIWAGPVSIRLKIV
jgi:hypothetical protein